MRGIVVAGVLMSGEPWVWGYSWCHGNHGSGVTHDSVDVGGGRLIKT